MKGPIVVGTDGSETATEAATTAIALADAFKQELHVVSAYRPAPGAGADLPPEFAGLVSSSSRVDGILEDICSRARARQLKVVPHAVVGDAADAILTVAEAVNADLIVVGNKGIGSVKRFMLGNVPSKVVHNAPCSTHVVHTT